MPALRASSPASRPSCCAVVPASWRWPGESPLAWRARRPPPDCRGRGRRDSRCLRVLPPGHPADSRRRPPGERGRARTRARPARRRALGAAARGRPRRPRPARRPPCALRRCARGGRLPARAGPRGRELGARRADSNGRAAVGRDRSRGGPRRRVRRGRREADPDGGRPGRLRRSAPRAWRPSLERADAAATDAPVRRPWTLAPGSMAARPCSSSAHWRWAGGWG